MSNEINRFYQFGAYRLDVENRVLFRHEQAVAIPPKAVEVLIVLVEQSGQVVSKEQLMKLLWRDVIVEDANLTQNIFLLRKVFGEDGQKYIETIPRRGYRFAADVIRGRSSGSLPTMDAVRGPQIIETHTFAQIITEEEIDDDIDEARPGILPLADGVAQQDAIAAPRRFWHRRTVRLALGLAVFLTGVIVAAITFQQLPPSEIKTVAVLPLKALDADDSEALGLKLADALIQRLGRVRQLIVRPTRAVQRYEGKVLDPLAAGREQQVDAVLDGSFQRAGERLRVRVRLLRVGDGRQLWESTFEERGTDPFFLQDALAEQTAQAILPQLAGVERQFVSRHDTENLEAHRHYTEGRYHWNRRNIEGLKRSVAYFEQSIRLDPRYARAYAGLADSYITLSNYDVMPAQEAFPKAKAAALKALELDDTLVEAHTSLAMIKATYEWDWRGAELAFQQAIRLNPNYPTTHQWYSEYLAGMGRFEEALAEIRQAQELDPLSLIIRSVEAWVWYFARDYDQMLALSQRVIELEPTFGEVYAYVGLAYEQKGMFREAMDAYQKYSTLCGYNTPAATQLRAAAIADSREYWRKMVELAKPPTGSDFDAAQAWSRLGESDKALDLLEQSYAKRDYNIMYLKTHPNLDPLRANPRFQDLLRRTDLAQ